jgi:hypothetical protein
MTMRFSKTTNSKIWILSIFLIAILFLAIQLNAQSKGKIEPVKVSKDVPKAPQDLKMVADVLDVFGGKSESADFKMRMSAGGQPSPIGKSQNTSFKTSAGYVWSTFVLHGDADGDGIVDIDDVVYVIRYLFYPRPQPEPIPMEAGDVNCNGIINVVDVVYLINYIYISGPPPCAP